MRESSFPTVKSFIEHVGRQRFETELGHATSVVYRAMDEGVMPAHWYFDCRDWCREIGVTVPEHLFRRKHRPRHKQGAESAA